MIGGRWSPSRWSLWQGRCAPHRSFEHRLLDPDGTVRWVHIEAGTAFRTGSEHDAVRVIGLVTEIAGPRTSATAIENFASTGNREEAPMSLAEKQPCYCTNPQTYA